MQCRRALSLFELGSENDDHEDCHDGNETEPDESELIEDFVSVFSFGEKESEESTREVDG